MPESALDLEGARDLVLAIFRLAVCDYLGRRYGHDGPVSYQTLRRPGSSDRSAAQLFLTSPWATHLADLAGFSAMAAWRQTSLYVHTPIA